MNATQTTLDAVSRKIRKHHGYLTATGRCPRRYVLHAQELHPGTNFGARLEPRGNPPADVDRSDADRSRYLVPGWIDVADVVVITLHDDTVVRETGDGFSVLDRRETEQRYVYGI